MKIEYIYKLGNKQKQPPMFRDTEIPEEIKNIIQTHPAFSKSTRFGEKGIGYPDEIEILNIEFDNGEKKKFRYFNKGIHYVMMGGEKERPIFRVFAYFMT
jgi:hypothetical protein